MGADEWDDPHDLVPQSFKNRFSHHDSVRDALRHVERLPGSTAVDEDTDACPSCGSIQVSPVGTGNHELSEWNWTCNKCNKRFNEPDTADMDKHKESRRSDFEWCDESDFADPDDRGMDPLFAGLDGETLRALAIALYRPWTDAGPSYRLLAELFPYTRAWVGERVREWKGGEHRELVPDPTAVDAITVDEQGGATAVATDGGRVRRWGAFGS